MNQTCAMLLTVNIMSRALHLFTYHVCTDILGLKGKHVFLLKTCKNDPPPTPILLPCPRLQRGAADYDAPQELLSPLRAVNGLPLLLGPMQLAAAAEMESKRPPPPPSPP